MGPILKAYRSKLHYLRKVIRVYVGIMAFALVGSIIFQTNTVFRHWYTYNAFSLNKPVAKVNADVVGYTWHGRKGGRNSSSSHDYAYGLTYTVANQKYYAKADVAVSESGDYDAYIPLPKTYPIYVSTDNPAAFSYVTAHYGFQSYGNFATLFYMIFLGVLLALSFAKKEKLENQLVTFKDYMALIFALIFVSAPVYLLISTHLELYAGQTSDSFTSFALIRKNSKAFHAAHRDAPHLNMDIESRNGSDRHYRISGIEGHKIQRMFVKTSSGKQVDVKFVRENKYILLYDPAEFSIEKQLVYFVSDAGQYGIPLEMIQYDFDYKT